MAGRELPESCAACIVPDSTLGAPPHVPGAREAWDISLPELQRQVDSEDTRQVREKVINIWEAMGFWKQIAHGKPLHELPEIRLGAYPAFEAEAVRWLAWYAHYHHPRNYVEIGIRWGFSASIVAVGCPGVEIYGIDAWQKDRGPPPSVWNAPHSIQASSAGLAVGWYDIRHYTRFITGEPRTAVQRLFSGTAAPQAVDLAYVRTDPAYGDATENALQIADHLASGGMLVLLGSRPSEVEPVTLAIRQRYPDYFYLTTNFGLGAVILAAILQQ